jgi:quaternary ammonium compound-resistance protein SugE
MPWLYIVTAGMLESIWPFFLKTGDRFVPWPWLFGGLFSVPILYLLTKAMVSLPAGTVYAAFVGIGVAGTAIIGMTLFGEATNPGRIASLMLVLAGAIGLRVFSE